MTAKFDPQATPECDAFSDSIDENDQSFESLIQLLSDAAKVCRRQEKRARCAEHENAKLKEKLRIAVEALRSFTQYSLPVGSHDITLKPHELKSAIALKQIEEVGK